MDNESIKTWSVRRSHLEVQLTFLHEAIYFQVIKSQVWTKLGADVWTSRGQGVRCEVEEDGRK